VCVSEMNDEFTGNSLDTSRWDFVHPTTLPGEIAVADGAVSMLTGDHELDGAGVGPVNFIGQPLPPGEQWTVTTKVSIEHLGGWQMAGLMIYQSDTNLLRVSFTNSQSNGNTYLETSRDDPPSGSRSQGGSVA